MQKLSQKQELFAREYLVDLNGLQAGIRAGYTPLSAKRNSTRLLKHPSIKAFIEKETKKKAEKLELSAEVILAELLSLAKSDIRKIFNEDGTLKPISEIPDSIAQAISGIEIDEIFEYDEKGDKIWTGYTKKVKLWDKPKALELLARHLSLLNDKLEVNHNFNFADKIKEARERFRDAIRTSHSSN